jgi:hypothetical protein
MSYTAYLYDKSDIKEQVKALTASVKINVSPDTDLLKHGLMIINQRLQKDPQRYHDYGPYWWAIKSLLIVQGYTYQQECDHPVMKSVYKGDRPVETLVMAENFRNFYLSNFIVYSNQFLLDEESGILQAIVDSDLNGKA